MDQLTARPESGRALLLAGLQEHYTMENAVRIPELWDRLYSYFDSVPQKIGRVTYGLVTHPRNGAGGFDYLAAVEVPAVSGLPSEFVSATIPAQRYLVYSHGQHLSKLRETMAAVWKKWIAEPEHSREYGLDVIERYGERFNPVTELGDIEIWVPVSGRLGQ